MILHIYQRFRDCFLSIDTIFVEKWPRNNKIISSQVLLIFKIKIAIITWLCKSRDSKFRYSGIIFDPLSDGDKMEIIRATFRFLGFYLWKPPINQIWFVLHIPVLSVVGLFLTVCPNGTPPYSLLLVSDSSLHPPWSKIIKALYWVK